MDRIIYVKSKVIPVRVLRRTDVWESDGKAPDMLKVSKHGGHYIYHMI
jgi:hypothetical protein